MGTQSRIITMHFYKVKGILVSCEVVTLANHMLPRTRIKLKYTSQMRSSNYPTNLHIYIFIFISQC